MAQVKINKERFVEGRFTVKQRVVDTDEMIIDKDGNEVPKQEIVIHGIFSTHDYIEELDILESERYLIQGVHVFEETFGTNDYEIIYEFTADSFTVKKDYVPDKVKVIVEANLYQDENTEYFHSVNWNIAEEIYDDIINGGKEVLEDGEQE